LFRRKTRDLGIWNLNWFRFIYGHGLFVSARIRLLQALDHEIDWNGLFPRALVPFITGELHD